MNIQGKLESDFKKRANTRNKVSIEFKYHFLLSEKPWYNLEDFAKSNDPGSEDQVLRDKIIFSNSDARI